jgi:PmbA protein
MEPEVAAELLGNVVSALSADAALKGRSMFLGKEGQAVAASAVTLVDQGDRRGGLGSMPFDGEGVPTGRTELLRAGTLSGWLHNTYTARRMGAQSTGNAVRPSFRGVPGVGPTNLWLEPGPQTPEELLKGVQRGLHVVLSKNVGGINPVNGDYSVGASGVWIEDGAIAHPVSQVTIAGNMLEMLRNVAAIGSDLRWIPSGGVIGTPTLHFADMTVAGT